MHGLAFTLAMFGTAKLIKTQFWLPNVAWDTPVGELTGFYATWAYFGASRPLSVTLGLVELVAATLVLPTRTRLLGLALAIPMLVGIVLIDICYRVVPGLYVAIGLLGLSGILVGSEWADVRAILGHLLRRTATHSIKSRVVTASLGVVTIVAGALTLVPVACANHASTSAIDGIWIVESAPADVADWDAIYFELEPRCAIRAGRQLTPCEFTLESDHLELRFETRVITAHIELDSERLSIEASDGTLHLRRKPTPDGGRP